MPSSIFKTSAALMLALCLGPVLQAQSPAQSGSYTIVTAEIVEPLVRGLVDAYQQAHPEFKTSLISTLNSGVVKAFIDGKTPFAPSSSGMTPQELSEFAARWGYQPTRISICMDALAILVNRNNPIKYIRIEQADAVFSTTRNQGWPKSIDTWGELGVTSDDWSSRPIQLYGHPEGSGTRKFFREVVELNGTGKPETRRGEDIQQMIETIMANQATIGYGSFTQAQSQLKALPLIPKGGKTPIEVKAETIANGSYPLGRVIYFYVNKPTNKAMDPNILRFLTFVLSKEGQRVVALNNFVPLPDELATIGLSRLTR